MWIIDPTSRPNAYGGETALIQVELGGEIRSLMTVINQQPGDRVLAGPVELTYPSDAANVLTRDIMDNIFNSMNHAESWPIVTAVTNEEAIIISRGNPGDPNSIELWAGVDPMKERATIAGLWMDSWKSAYFLFEVPVQPYPGDDLLQLGNSSWWYSRWQVVAINAWYLSFVKTREVVAEFDLLPRELGQIRFHQVLYGYNLNIRLASFAW